MNTTVPLHIYYLKKEYINQDNGSVVKRISHLTTDQEFRVRILAEPPIYNFKLSISLTLPL